MKMSHASQVHISRRTALGAAAAATTLTARATSSRKSHVQGKAEHVISVWLGGGMAQVDTFDPKGKGDPKARKPGCYYDTIDTAVPGVQLSQHLSGLARQMDKVTAVRTVNHGTIDEHAAATNRMHTGRPISGTVQYPSLGSMIAHQRGAVSDDAPPYVLIGYPNVTRGPGFLGTAAGYLYLTNTSQGPAGLSRPPGISERRQNRREKFLALLREKQPVRPHLRRQAYEETTERALRLSGPEFGRAFELDSESAELRNAYGGEFGQRCLLARRLVQRGVRFIEVSHNLNFLNGAGWDVHNEGILNQHRLIQELDSAISTLITDLQRVKLLDRTLIVITTEFGRPSGFDSKGGRAHQGSAFTCVLAGGGLNHCGAYGTTDELGKKIVANPVSVPDLFATIMAAVGVDPHRNVFDGDRPVPLTDRGNPVKSLFT